jgi:hypothetical protein
MSKVCPNTEDANCNVPRFYASAWLVVSTLEQAMSDPRQPIGPVGSVLQMAVALKSRLESPYDLVSTTNPLPQVNEIEDDHVRRIAATLPLR